ncbi:MAG TPA: hypothetical protein VGF84_20965, partial [Micromonosporaceae bacterium]
QMPYEPETTYDQPFSMEPGVVRRAGSPRWLIAAGILAVVLVAACVGAFVVVGFGAKSVSDRIGQDQQAAARDVRVGGCVSDPTTGFMTASIQITNHGTDSASYVVDVAFDGADGKRELDTGVAAASNVVGGGTATVLARAASAGPSGFVCRILEATRF